MGRRSCSPWPESAWDRVMMAPPIDVVGLRPRLGDVEAPPRSRSSPSSMVEVESEPLGRARRRPSAEARAESEPWGRAERCLSSSGAEPKSEPTWLVCALGWAMWRLLRGRGRGRVRLPWSRSSPSPWVGRGGDRQLRPGLSPSPGVRRSGVRRLPGLSPSPSPGSGGAEFTVFRGLARVRALGRAERSSPSSGA
jgi:hypothetical protein